MYIFKTGNEMIDTIFIYISAVYYYFAEQIIQLKNVQVIVGFVIIVLTILKIVRTWLEIKQKYLSDEQDE